MVRCCDPVQKKENQIQSEVELKVIRGGSVDLDEIEKPLSLYRYQEEIENFYEGNIWFSGVSQSRFFQYDPLESCDFNGKAIQTFTLSTSVFPPDTDFESIGKKRPDFHRRDCVKIKDISLFIHKINEELPRQKHCIEFFEKDVLIKKIKCRIRKEENEIESKIKEIKEDAFKKIEKAINDDEIEEINKEMQKKIARQSQLLNLLKDHLKGVELTNKPKSSIIEVDCYVLQGWKVDYYKPKEPVKSNLAALNYYIDEEHRGEGEYRISLNLFPKISENLDATFYNLVKYVKVNCPGIKEFCEIVKCDGGIIN